MTLEKSYQPAELESFWIKSWEELGYAQCSTDATKPNFCIQLPPPNVTGTLHMGHAFNQTIMDALTRYHRMRGYNALWQPGTDHAGIATQLVVERQLQQQEQKTRHDLGREAFISKIWAWKEQSGNTITSQMRRLGASVDWGREYFTMDEQCSSAVTEVFVRLYEQGLIYRDKRQVNWDPVLKTAVSDLEVETVETEGFLWHIQYPLCEPDAEKGLTHLTVATTRPETLLGDVAVMVHPEDVRYQHLIGKNVHLPLCNRTIPIIADAYVDSSFGTGVVKVTPAHDFNDYAVGQRHGLPLIIIFTLDGKIVGSPIETINREMDEQRQRGHRFQTATANIREEDAIKAIPIKYRGLDRFEARKLMLQDLEDKGLLADTKPHKLMLPKGDRTGAIIEPMPTDQWFVATNKVAQNDPTGKSLCQKAIDAVNQGDVKFVPEQWVNTYMQWMNNIQDWCISRQLWWGHRIPAWYGDNGKIYVARNLAEAQTKAKQDEYLGPLHQDLDVLDTWFSSALVPFSTLGWPNETPELQHFLPSTVLVTGFDIIFFWVARMVMMTTHFTGKVPFHTVYVHGLVRDAEGKKMSKSVGNTLDPVDLIDGCALETLVQKRTTGLAKPQDAPKIEKRTRKEFPDGIPAYGADALRFTFASLASLGRNINFDQKRCEGYRNFCNKLWNATRFVLMNTEGHDCGTSMDANVFNANASMADQWIISTLQRAEQDMAQAYETHRLDLAAQCLYQLVWDEYCDWYLEIAKVQLTNGNADQQRATRRTLIRVLETILRLAHPIIPFITESLWQVVSVSAGKRKPEEHTSLMVQPYPVCDPARINETAELQMQQLKSCIDVIRALRGEMNIGPGQKVPLLIEASSLDANTELFTEFSAVLCALAKLNSVTLVEYIPSPCHAPIRLFGHHKLMLDIQIDLATERKKIQSELQKAQLELDKCKHKLANPAFIDKAPSNVVLEEKKRLEYWQQKADALSKQLEQLKAI